MKAFISFRFTGEDTKLLEPLLKGVHDAFNRVGISAYSTFSDEQMFKDNRYTRKQILEHAFKIIGDSDFLFVLQTSDNKSEGMLMEIGYSLAEKKPIIVAVKDGVESGLVSPVANSTLTWSDTSDLEDAIVSFDYQSII